jgi:hypothetical protein
MNDVLRRVRVSVRQTLLMYPTPCVCPSNLRLRIRRSVSVRRAFANVSETMGLSVEPSLMYPTLCVCTLEIRLPFGHVSVRR